MNLGEPRGATGAYHEEDGESNGECKTFSKWHRRNGVVRLSPFFRGIRIDSAGRGSNGTELQVRARGRELSELNGGGGGGGGVSTMHFITDKICSLQLCCRQRIEAPTGRYVARLPEEIGSQDSLTVTQYWVSTNSWLTAAREYLNKSDIIWPELLAAR